MSEWMVVAAAVAIFCGIGLALGRAKARRPDTRFARLWAPLGFVLLIAAFIFVFQRLL